LRKKLAALDQKKRYVPFCEAGLRSYIGHRILIQHGFQSISLAGGFRIFKGVREKIETLTKTPFDSQQ
jgi:rhodanese-related sulfurtransferase